MELNEALEAVRSCLELGDWKFNVDEDVAKDPEKYIHPLSLDTATRADIRNLVNGFLSDLADSNTPIRVMSEPSLPKDDAGRVTHDNINVDVIFSHVFSTLERVVIMRCWTFAAHGAHA